MRCSVCRRWLGHTRYRLVEDAAPGETQRHWRVCAECKAAVEAEVERAGLESAARLRVAIGMVAASRPPRQSLWDDGYWENLDDRGVNRLLIWLFGIAFVVHAIAFLAVAVYISFAH